LSSPSPSASALPPKANVLGVLISATDYVESTARILEAAEHAQPFTVAVCPVHSVMEGNADRAFAAVLNHMDLAVPDGQPVRWTMRWTGQAALEERVYGPTLMLHVLAGAEKRGLPVFFYGSRQRTLELLRARMLERFPALEIAGMAEGLYRNGTEKEREENARRIASSGAKVVFCGLGCPRQEWWMFHQRDAIGVPLIGVGAAFDFHAGLVKQAPPWMQRRGLEWAFRLSREPRRLLGRYASSNPAFVAGVVRQLAGRTMEPYLELNDARGRACPL
jgi:N-acetylglucosaminyldiphosphoundecaprenol N-acetyl-beta-D-mannosaminyltransferase